MIETKFITCFPPPPLFFFILLQIQKRDVSNVFREIVCVFWNKHLCLFIFLTKLCPVCIQTNLNERTFSVFKWLNWNYIMIASTYTVTYSDCFSIWKYATCFIQIKNNVSDERWIICTLVKCDFKSTTELSS